MFNRQIISKMIFIIQAQHKIVGISTNMGYLVSQTTVSLSVLNYPNLWLSWVVVTLCVRQFKTIRGKTMSQQISTYDGFCSRRLLILLKCKNPLSIHFIYSPFYSVYLYLEKEDLMYLFRAWWFPFALKPIKTHHSQDKMAAISQTTFSNAFLWMKKHEYRIKFH